MKNLPAAAFTYYWSGVSDTPAFNALTVSSNLTLTISNPSPSISLATLDFAASPTITGNLKVEGTLTVDGATTLDGATTITNTLTVSPTSGSFSVNSSGNVGIGAPSSGIALTVTGVTGAGNNVAKFASGQGATSAVTDVQITRAGSTANAVAKGPNIQFDDTSNNNSSMFQNSGGQTELWQNNAGTWAQVMYIGTGGEMFIQDDNAVMLRAGYKGLPQNLQNANYTFVLNDRSKSVIFTASGNVTYTIPSGVFNAGDVITVINFGSSGDTITIARGSSVNLWWANATETDANRTVTAVGYATIYCAVSSTGFVISGTGIS